MDRKATINDVALAAQASISTVSHAISGKRRISSEVRQRVFTAMKELGYQPRRQTVSTPENGKPFIGVLIDQCRNPISMEVIDALQREFQARGLCMLLSVGGHEVEGGRELVSAVAGAEVAGIVNMMPQIDNAMMRELCRGKPFVTFMRHEHNPVEVDFRGALLQSLDYLWQGGHRRISFITLALECDGRQPGWVDWYSGYMRERGVCEADLLIGRASDERDSIIAASQLGPRSTAIVARNDFIACGVYQWAYSAGRKIPEDLSVIGFDDSLAARTAFPLLTTNRFPCGELARRTVEELMARMRGAPDSPAAREKTLLLPEFVVRNSVSSPKGRVGQESEAAPA